MQAQLRQMRKAGTLVVALAIALILLLGLGTPSASAAVPAGYKGLARVAPADRGYYAPAWRWYQGSGWAGGWRERDLWVWVQPYADSYVWTYRSDRGWVAMKGADLAPWTELRGTVTYGPMCPVEPCSLRQPVIQLTFTSRSTGKVVAQTTTSSSSYQTWMPPGEYVVTAKPSGMYMSPRTIRLGATGSAKVNFSIDTGIR